MKTKLKKRNGQARWSSGRLVRRLMKIVTENGKFAYGTPTRCLDVVEHVFAAYRRMAENLQACVQKHNLGLGGEHVDEIVCAKVEELLGGNPAPMAEIEARIKAHTQPDEHTVCELALCEATRLVLKPDQLYRFTVREGCAACHDAALVDTDGRKPPF
jgi:hypothetical protein